MKKIIAITAALFTLGINAHGQAATSSASQTTKLSLSNAIDIVFTGSGTATGALVTMAFANTTDYETGIESAAQQLRVRSNKTFNVAVKANASSFTYTGAATADNVMPVSGVLNILVSANSTGGTTNASFNGVYATLTNANQTLITSGTKGNNQTFAVKYKATPGFAYAAGDYAVDVVYTVTQQ